MFIAQWIFYVYIYSGGVSSNRYLPLYMLIVFFSFALEIIAEIVLILILSKIANRTRIPLFKYMVIIHIVYILSMLSYNFLLPLIVNQLFSHVSIEEYIRVFNIVYTIAGFGVVIILLLNDWVLYQLCKRELQPYPVKMAFVIYLPFVLMGMRLIFYIIGLLFSHPLIQLVFTGFNLVIPIVWIFLGWNFKSIETLSQTTMEYTSREPRLDYYTLQRTQPNIGINPQANNAPIEIYGVCPRCGKPRLTQVEIFCSYCGNRF